MQAEVLGKQRSFSVCKEKSREVKICGVHLETDKQPQFLTLTVSSWEKLRQWNRLLGLTCSAWSSVLCNKGSQAKELDDNTSLQESRVRVNFSASSIHSWLPRSDYKRSRCGLPPQDKGLISLEISLGLFLFCNTTRGSWALSLSVHLHLGMSRSILDVLEREARSCKVDG